MVVVLHSLNYREEWDKENTEKKRYKTYVGSKTTETSIKNFLSRSLATKALGMVVRVKDADADAVWTEKRWHHYKRAACRGIREWGADHMQQNMSISALSNPQQLLTNSSIKYSKNNEIF